VPKAENNLLKSKAEDISLYENKKIEQAKTILMPFVLRRIKEEVNRSIKRCIVQPQFVGTKAT
jgi:hypothetical protein